MPRPNASVGRLGRFKVAPGNSLPIIKDATGILVRLINPRDRGSMVIGSRFRVSHGSHTAEITLGSSLDFFAGATSNDLTVAPIPPVGGPQRPARGIYEVLSNHRPAPSGRFRFTDNSEHLVIDFTEAPSGSSGRYRILNSGDESFDVIVGTATSQVASRGSLDFLVGSGMQVKIQASTGSPANPVKGILELLDTTT